MPHSMLPMQEAKTVTASMYGLVATTPVFTTANPLPYASHPSNPYVTSTSTHSNHNGSVVPNHIHLPGNTRVVLTSHTHLNSHHDYQQNITGENLGQVGCGQPSTSNAMVNDSSPSSSFHQHHQSYHYHHHHSSNHHHRHHRKRKSPVPMMESDPDDDSETCSSRRTTTPTDESSKKQNHSEIEKRRRDKMNTYITELAGMVPMCTAMSRKLDKLTVLRMTVQHIKTLRGSRIHSYTEGYYKPPCLTDTELKHLILQSAEGFLFVVDCDRGRLLYVSESVYQVLNYNQSDLLGQSWFDILHPKDVVKVKEQLSCSDLAPRERLIDAKTMLPVKGNVPQKANRLGPGARRSFFCRMKYKNFPMIKEEDDSNCGCQRRIKSSNCERKFCVIHCTGYLKSWTKVEMEDTTTEAETDDTCNLSCLVAVGRILKPIISPSLNSKCKLVTFTSRHGIDGKFVFVDQRTTVLVEFLPQELLGTSMYEYFHHEDISSLAEVHKTVLVSSETITTPLYRFRTKSGNYVRLQSSWKAFQNPWTRDIEYIIAKNILAGKELEHSISDEGAEMEDYPNDYDFFSGNATVEDGIKNEEIQRLINSDVTSGKIGEKIANEAVESQNDPSSCNNLVLDASTRSDFDLQLTPMSHQTQFHILQSVPISQHPSPMSSQCLGDGSSSGETSGYSSGPSNTERLPHSHRTRDPVMGSTVAVHKRDVSNNQVLTRLNGNVNSIPNLGNTSNIIESGKEMTCITGEDVVSSDPSTHTVTENGNDDMAVIMSLLDMDTVGEPVDFSVLPWSLP